MQVLGAFAIIFPCYLNTMYMLRRLIHIQLCGLGSGTIDGSSGVKDHRRLIDHTTLYIEH
jgi:hypothetical protein